MNFQVLDGSFQNKNVVSAVAQHKIATRTKKPSDFIRFVIVVYMSQLVPIFVRAINWRNFIFADRTSSVLRLVKFLGNDVGNSISSLKSSILIFLWIFFSPISHVVCRVFFSFSTLGTSMKSVSILQRLITIFASLFVKFFASPLSAFSTIYKRLFMFSETIWASMLIFTSLCFGFVLHHRMVSCNKSIRYYNYAL